MQADAGARARLELRGAAPLRCFHGSSARRRGRTACAAPAVAFKNFGDGLLDYMEAGPKLRKWYGEGERRPSDGQGPDPEEEQEEPAGPADAVLVTDGDSPTGELVILQLILARVKVTALVRDPVATQAAYGDYVTPVQGRVGDGDSLYKAMRTARAVICPTATGALPDVLAARRLGHVVLLSSVGAAQSGFFGKLLGSEAAVLADPSREEALRSAGSPLTIVRVGKLRDEPGGAAQLTFSQGDAGPAGDISREDAAQVLVRALTRPPKGVLAFAVGSQRSGQQTQWGELAGLSEAA